MIDNGEEKERLRIIYLIEEAINLAKSRNDYQVYEVLVKLKFKIMEGKL